MARTQKRRIHELLREASSWEIDSANLFESISQKESLATEEIESSVVKIRALRLNLDQIRGTLNLLLAETGDNLSKAEKRLQQICPHPDKYQRAQYDPHEITVDCILCGKNLRSR